MSIERLPIQRKRVVARNLLNQGKFFFVSFQHDTPTIITEDMTDERHLQLLRHLAVQLKLDPAAEAAA